METILGTRYAMTEHSKSTADYLRGDLLRSFIVLAILTTWGVIVLQLLDDGARQPGVALVIASLAISVVLAWHLVAQHPTLSGIVLLGGTICALVLILLIYPGTPFIYGFVLVAVVATQVGGLIEGSATAFVISLIVFFLHSFTTGVLLVRDEYAVICLVWLGVVIAWLGTRATQTAVNWAWQSYDETVQKISEARVRQAELGRVSKSLREAYDRLEQLNRELDRARQAAEEARQLKVEFATTISHELRTPMNLIIGFAEMMVAAPHSYQGDSLPASYRGDVEAIYRNACQLSDLLDDVLDLSQIDAHRLALQKEDIALPDIVQQAADTVCALYQDLGLTLTLELPPGLPLLYADPTRVRQIVINLLTNAVRFTDVGGVTVHASFDDRDVTVAVTDTGCGISPDNLPHLFHEFARVASAPRRKGNGLGLAVSKRFAELHGGTMWAESTLGAGSTFYFTLPRTRNVVPGIAERDWRACLGESAEPESRVAVVVGKDVAAAEVFRRYLDGYRVLGPVGLGNLCRLKNSQEVDLIILTEPLGARSIEPGRGLGARFARVPIVTCSFNTTKSRREELGVSEYLTKPIVRSQFRRVLDSFGRNANRILLVEDDPALARLYLRMIKSLQPQCQVVQVGDGNEALRLIQSEPPDLVFLDLLLPGVDGYAVAREIRANARLDNLPVVVITGQEKSDHTVIASELTLTRLGGLTAGEVMHFVKGVLSLPRKLSPTPPEGFSE